MFFHLTWASLDLMNNYGCPFSEVKCRPFCPIFLVYIFVCASAWWFSLHRIHVSHHLRILNRFNPFLEIVTRLSVALEVSTDLSVSLSCLSSASKFSVTSQISILINSLKTTVLSDFWITSSSQEIGLKDNCFLRPVYVHWSASIRIHSIGHWTWKSGNLASAHSSAADLCVTLTLLLHFSVPLLPLQTCVSLVYLDC